MNWTDGGAELSADGIYRYRLWRRWAPRNNGQGHAVFVMLNPSTADEKEDDATIRRCIGFAKRWGHGGIEVVNLFAYRSTDPRVLGSFFLKDGLPVDVIGDPHNLDAIVDVCSKNGPVVLAWGAHAHGHLNRIVDVETQLRRLRVPLYTLGLTKYGQPAHPLRLPYARPVREQTVPVVFLRDGVYETPLYARRPPGRLVEKRS